MAASEGAFLGYGTSTRLLRQLATASLVVVVAAALSACSGSPSGDEPAGSPAPFDEFGSLMVACLTAKGWHVEAVGPRGYVTPDGIPEDQTEQFDSDVADCIDSHGFDQPPSVSQSEAEQLYDALLEVAACVAGLGYPVPDPPSRQAFVEDLVEWPIPSWHPYYVVNEAADPTEAERVRESCPVPSG